MRKYLVHLSLFLSVGAMAFSMYVYIQTPKVAIVRSAIVIQKYQGMKEASALYQEKSKTWQSNLDTLALDFQRAVNTYNSDYNKLSRVERSEQERKLDQQKDALDKYKNAIFEKAKQEELEYTEGVLNQINGFIEQFAKERRYTVVLGTTNSGNILYGSEYIDITDEVLNGLNASYKK